jgi:nicotinamidase-related amidase
MRSRDFLVGAAAVAAALFVAAASPLRAADLMAEWASVKPPPAPELKPVTLDPKTTALLILDVNKPNCAPDRRLRCFETLPHIRALMDAARAAGAPVLYTFGGGGTPADIADPGLAWREGEVVAARGADKFFGSELEQQLKGKGVETIIVTGTAANGSVIGTGSGGVSRGFKVIVPIDAMSGDSAYIEQYVAFHLATAPALAGRTTLTRTDMIRF